MPVQKLLVPLHSQLSREAIAQMAESVDALVSNTSGAIHPGSIPGLGTKSCKFSTCGSFFVFRYHLKEVSKLPLLLRPCFSNVASILGFTLHLFARNADKQRGKRGEGLSPKVHFAFTPSHLIIYIERGISIIERRFFLSTRRKSSLLHDNFLTIYDVKSCWYRHSDALASLHVRLVHHLTAQIVDAHRLSLVGRNQDFSITAMH
mgnify:FL=1